MHKFALTAALLLALLANVAQADDLSVAGGRTVILPSPNAEVCFYTMPHYAGTRWCVRSGSRAASLPKGWDDAISSIRISRGGAVHVCRQPGFSGGCTIYVRNRPRLSDFDNAISAFAVLPPWGGSVMPR